MCFHLSTRMCYAENITPSPTKGIKVVTLLLVVLLIDVISGKRPPWVPFNEKAR